VSSISTVSWVVLKRPPFISVDCKKKELLGNFKNNGREWQAQGEATNVNVYDFLSLADGKAVPYGVYDLVHNQGFVNVGIDHDTHAMRNEFVEELIVEGEAKVLQNRMGSPEEPVKAAKGRANQAAEREK